MRTIAVATISFGLLDIPVRVYASIESKSEIKFNQLHGKCGARLKQQYVCTKCDDVVDREAMVKGYEFAKDRYVTFAADELKLLEQAEEPTNQRVAVTAFIDPVFAFVSWAHVEHCYFIGSHEGSEKQFATLVRAMGETRTLAIAKYTTRGKTHPVVLGVQHDRLEMVQLRAGAELRPITDVPTFDVEPSDEHVRLAADIIEQLRTDKLDLAGYVDEQQQRLQEHIQQKIDGEELVAAPTAARPAPIVNVVDALRASLKPAPAKKRGRRATSASST